MRAAASLCAIALTACGGGSATTGTSAGSSASPSAVVPAPSASASSAPPDDALAHLPPLDLPPATIRGCVERITSGWSAPGVTWTRVVREMLGPHGVTMRWSGTSPEDLWIETFAYRDGMMQRRSEWSPAERYTEEFAYDERRRLVRITSGGDRASQSITVQHTGSVPDGWTLDEVGPPCADWLPRLDGDVARVQSWRRWKGSGDGRAAVILRGVGLPRTIDVRFRDGLPVAWTFTSYDAQRTAKIRWAHRQLVDIRCDVTVDGEAAREPYSVVGAAHAAGRLQRLTLAHFGGPAKIIDVEVDAHGRLLGLVSGVVAVRLERDDQGREIERREIDGDGDHERTVTRYACSEPPPPIPAPDVASSRRR